MVGLWGFTDDFLSRHPHAFVMPARLTTDIVEHHFGIIKSYHGDVTEDQV